MAVAGPTVAQLEIFFSSDYLRIVSHFSLFHYSALIAFKPPVALAAVRSKAVVLLLLICC